jgi:hypothetical protein
MRLVGHSPLQARSAYQPIIQKQRGRYIAYVGHHDGEAFNPRTGVVETNGVSVVDVTNPARPRYLAHIPAVGGAQMVQACRGEDLPNGQPGVIYLLRTNGDDGHQIFDVTNPAQPRLLRTIISGLDGTHKNWWECDTGIAYLVSDLQPEGWSTDRGLKIYDLSNPARPRFIRNFALPEHAPGADVDDPFPGEGGFHEVTVLGDRVYAAYGTSNNGLLQILDRSALLSGPTQPTPGNLLAPEIGRLEMPDYWGGHTAWPLIGVDLRRYGDFEEGTPRDFVVLVTESTSNECQEPMHHMVFFVDITDPRHPFSVSNYQVKDPRFCQVGGRFGAHAVNWSYTPKFYKKLVFASYFNAGVRAIDVRDPYHPKEVGFFIPRTTGHTDERCVEVGGVDVCKIAIQTNNVEVDDRGLIYLADRANTGLHIVELTGEAKEIAETPLRVVAGGRQKRNVARGR